MSFAQVAAPKRYDPVARLLHWLVVLLVYTQFALGWLMPEVHRGTEPVGLIAWHLWVGALLLVAMIVRVVWRVTHRPPPAPKSMPTAMRVASTATHHLLYLVLVITPVLGWLNASVRDWPVTLFNVIPLPALAGPGNTLAHSIGEFHIAMTWVLLALIVLHVGAALFHRLVLKDQVLGRMI
jgi:cytochrome b561